MFQLLAIPRFAVTGYAGGVSRARRGPCYKAAASHEAQGSKSVVFFGFFFFFLAFTQIRYKEEFEKNKGKGFSVVADTPELQRIKKTQDQISNVSGFSSLRVILP